MATEDNTETPVEDAPVIVGDVDTAPDEVTVEGDTTVVVETPDDSADTSAVDAVVIENAIDTAAELAELRARLAAVEERTAVAEITADIALEATEQLAEADEEIVAAADEAIVETIEGAEIDEGNPLTDEDDEIVVDEIAPVSSRVHPWFRSYGDWRAGRN